MRFSYGRRRFEVVHDSGIVAITELTQQRDEPETRTANRLRVPTEVWRELSAAVNRCLPVAKMVRVHPKAPAPRTRP